MQRDFASIATKSADVFLHPFYRESLIANASVGRFLVDQRLGLRKPEDYEYVSKRLGVGALMSWKDGN